LTIFSFNSVFYQHFEKNSIPSGLAGHPESPDEELKNRLMQGPFSIIITKPLAEVLSQLPVLSAGTVRSDHIVDPAVFAGEKHAFLPGKLTAAI
jgi:hypothetical protein